MKITRRQFLLFTGGLAAAAQPVAGSLFGGSRPRIVDLGPKSQYLSDGVYDRFRDQGVFVIRKGGKLVALSSVCTHQKCKLIAQPDRSFHCNCHGSNFDPSGKVISGPAKRNLPEFPIIAGKEAHLLVTVSGEA